MSIKVIDNVLEPGLADALEKDMVGAPSEFPWFYNDTITFDSERDRKEFCNIYKFSHIFYWSYAPCSPYIQKLNPIFRTLEAEAIVNVRAYLTTYTGSAYEGDFHTDEFCDDMDSVHNRYTAIYYVNTNNGHTLFDDGQKVASVKNRLVVFPFRKRHAIVTATDVKARAVININYYSMKSYEKFYEGLQKAVEVQRGAVV